MNILKCPVLIYPSIKKKKSQDILLIHQSNREQLLSIFYKHGNRTLRYRVPVPEGRAKKRQEHQQNVLSWWWGDACARPSSAVQILQQQKHINSIVFNSVADQDR
jgi:hypothetical protein